MNPFSKMTTGADIEPVLPSSIISRFESDEFKLGPIPFSYNCMKSRREMIELLKKGMSLSHYEFISVLLFMSGSSMDEVRSLTSSFINIGTSGEPTDPSRLTGRGFGLVRLTCNHLDMFKGRGVKRCVFSADGGETWTGIDGLKLVTRSAKSWIAYLYNSLYVSISSSYDRSYFAHDIRQWGIYEATGTGWALQGGKTYRADARSLDELETVLYQSASTLITGSRVTERIDTPLPMSVKRRLLEYIEEQGREKRARIDLSIATEDE